MIRIDRIHAVPAVVLGGLLLTVPALAQSSTQSVAGYPQVGAQPQGASISSEQTTKSFTQAPVAHFFGMPVVIASPVDASYDAAAAYSTYEGQPGYGPNAVLENNDAGSPQ